MPDLITSDEQDFQILYVVPGSTAFILLAASFVADGTGLNADFVPMIEILAPDKRELFVFGNNLIVKQHATVFATFAPDLTPSLSPVLATTTFCQTNMPALEFGANYTIRFFGAALTGFGPDPAMVISSMSMMVEVTKGAHSQLDYGPFKLVPGPGA